MKKSIIDAYPNWTEGHSTIEYIVAEGDKVAYRVRHEGTQLTGKKIQWTNTGIVRVEDGKWAELWSTNDELNLMQQLGIIPTMEEIQKKRQEEQTEEENKAKQRRVFEEALNKGNMAVVDEVIDTNYMSESPQGVIRGPEGMKQGWTNLRAAFPDIHFTVEDMISEGDKVVTRIICKGTHKGEFMGIPPTDKKMTIKGIIITRWVDGKEVETWEVIDMLGMMQQLGAIPSQ